MKTRTILAGVVLAAAALLVGAGSATAHPLGNFSVNQLTVVAISTDRVDVRYVLDQAEIPTFRERGVSDAELLRRKRAEVARRLELTVDGRAVALQPAGDPVLTHPAGQGGLRTTRLELPLSAPARGARSVSVHDGTFPGRVGWKAVQVRPGNGTAVRTSAPATDPTGGLRRSWVLPEQLYPWLTLASGLLVVGVGVAVLRRRAHAHAHHHDHHHHHHHHHRKSLLAMGASAGLIPCPSALVVLLGAVAQHRIGLGLILIVAFSAGLAATLTGLGIAVVHARRLLSRLPVPSRLATAVPALSAALIVVVGLALTVQAVPQIA